MIILDYPKRTEGTSLVLPPFHNGHLGLLPDTRVTVRLMNLYGPGPTPCELVVTPYANEPENMAVLTCTLHDNVGVVGKLVDALSELNVNIVTQESSALNYQNDHIVSMVLDLAYMRHAAKATNESVVRHYALYESLFPVRDQRYVDIFESIAVHVANVIKWTEGPGGCLPEVHLRPLGVKENVKDPQPPGEAVVVRDPKRPYHIRIPIPDAIVSLLYRQLGTERSEPLTYLLVSDTDQRLLRAFFPTPATARHLVHLGFYHNDTPGALSAMMQALAGAEFNIVAGLLRKQDRLRSVWEVVLEYKGTSTMPDQGSGEELCTWVAKTLAELADNHHELHRCEIKVGLPLYPRSSWSGQIALNSYLRNDPARIRQDQKQLLNEALATAKARSRDDDERPRAIELLETVGRRMEGPVKPTLFLSYPFSASRHAGLVAKKLGDRYEIVDYRDPNGMIEYKEGQSDAIVQTVAKLIVACDCFLGIWHHDETMPTEDGKFGISPWLPFEYGLAVAANKPTVVIHSEKLDKDVWGRIDPGIKNPEYSDILFQDTLDMLDRYFKGR